MYRRASIWASTAREAAGGSQTDMSWTDIHGAGSRHKIIYKPMAGLAYHGEGSEERGVGETASTSPNFSFTNDTPSELQVLTSGGGSSHLLRQFALQRMGIDVDTLRGMSDSEIREVIRKRVGQIHDEKLMGYGVTEGNRPDIPLNVGGGALNPAPVIRGAESGPTGHTLRKSRRDLKENRSAQMKREKKTSLSGGDYGGKPFASGMQPAQSEEPRGSNLGRY